MYVFVALLTEGLLQAYGNLARAHLGAIKNGTINVGEEAIAAGDIPAIGKV